MAVSRSTNENARCTDQAATLAKSLAPEDVRAGDYVAVLHIVHEFPAIVWCDDTSLIDRNEIVRLPFVPENGGQPLKVISVCLPFVLVKYPGGKQRSLDVRHCRLARLDRAYAKAAVGKRKPKKKRRKRRK